jgi:tRNA nucleotidyltransferase (CCA-adding enzyme)
MLLDSLEVWDIHGQEVAVGTATADAYVDSASVLTHYICDDLGYRVAIAIIDMPERLQIVARSRLAHVDIDKVLKHVGGGGHPQAAAAALRGVTAKEVVPRLREALLAEVSPPMKAADIASSPVRSISPETTMAEAGRVMATWGHGGLPVLDGETLVGLVTRKDVDKAARHGLAHAPVTGFMARPGHGDARFQSGQSVRRGRPGSDLQNHQRQFENGRPILRSAGPHVGRGCQPRVRDPRGHAHAGEKL